MIFHVSHVSEDVVSRNVGAHSLAMTKAVRGQWRYRANSALGSRQQAERTLTRWRKCKQSTPRRRTSSSGNGPSSPNTVSHTERSDTEHSQRMLLLLLLLLQRGVTADNEKRSQGQNIIFYQIHRSHQCNRSIRLDLLSKL